VRRTSWRLFTALLLGIYCLRGVMLSCVIPPLEMWDEYQHVAYIDFLSQHRGLPILFQTWAPTRLIKAAIRLPQSGLGYAQLRDAGAREYAYYWGNPHPIVFNASAPRITLYEAQHPPVYYWLMAPIYRAAGGAARLAVAVSLLRLVNVAISAVGLAAFLAWLGRACRKSAHSMLIGAAVALHPLFLLNACRVANDSLAVTLGIIVIVWLLSLDGRRLLWHSAAIGALLGFAIMTKATDMILLPFAAFALVPLCISRKTTWPRAAAALVTLLAVTSLVTLPYFRFTYEHYKMLLPMGEALLNRTNHVPFQAYLDSIAPQKWPFWLGRLEAWFVYDGLWVGGWSLLYPPAIFPILYTVLVWAAIAAWPIRWLAARRSPVQTPTTSVIFKQPSTLPLTLAICVCMSVGLLDHGVVSAITYGATSTGPWYAELAMPWFLALVLSAALTWRPTRLGYTLAMLIPILFVVTELNGLWTLMIPAYSHKSLSLSALHRLSSLHPRILGTPTLFVSTGLMLALVMTAVVLCLRSLGEPPQQEIRSTSRTV
jgi:hypothetical protein